MVPIHPLGLLAPSTLYTSQELSHSWTTSQVIPLTWENSSQRYTKIDLTKNPSNRTLGSKIQEKLGLNGALKICKLWNNGALKNTLPRLKYNQE